MENHWSSWFRWIFFIRHMLRGTLPYILITRLVYNLKSRSSNNQCWLSLKYNISIDWENREDATYKSWCKNTWWFFEVEKVNAIKDQWNFLLQAPSRALLLPLKWKLPKTHYLSCLLCPKIYKENKSGTK